MAPMASAEVILRRAVSSDHLRMAALAGVVMPLASTLIVSLRLWVRFRGRQFKHDDGWVLPGLICSWSAFAVFYEGSSIFWITVFACSANQFGQSEARLLNGRTVVQMSFPESLMFGQLAIGLDLAVAMGLTFVKISILLFYLRAIGTTRSIQWPLYGGLAFMVGYGIVRLFLTIFMCKPVSALWDWVHPGHCLYWFNVQVSFMCINTATDLAILIFPMPIVWRLRVARKQKIGLCLVFLLGGLACVASIYRLYVNIYVTVNKIPLIANHDSQIKLNTSLFVELNLAIICACLPALRSSIRRPVSHVRARWVDMFGSSGSSKPSGSHDLPKLEAAKVAVAASPAPEKSEASTTRGSSGAASGGWRNSDNSKGNAEVTVESDGADYPSTPLQIIQTLPEEEEQRRKEEARRPSWLKPRRGSGWRL